VVAGDTVAYRITAQGTQLGDYESIKPSQPAKDIRIEEAFFAQFKAGKISNVWILTDTHAMLQQLTAA
jgi:predicted ester cyclase